MAESSAALAFAALDLIEDGEWDRYLLRLQAAIRARLATEGYRRGLVAGEPQ